MSQAAQTLIGLLLPEGILDYFELTSVGKLGKELQILGEKNIPTRGYRKEEISSKGFFPEVSIQDFPIRGQKVALCIKRRRWTVKSTVNYYFHDACYPIYK
ncbi:hypothetical protein ASE74_20130 [Pedobacter sp. Leaf216]|nr:hypothetical protein ASE74_20130 [Pedobacter sp. Leaf216]